jgi:hypothetical protein
MSWASNVLAVLALFSIRCTAGGALAWIAFDKIPTISVQSFDLDSKVVKVVADLGNDLGAMFTTVATTSSKGQYIVGIEEASASGAWLPSADCAKSPFPCANGTVCCSDPRAKKSAGACYKVASCDAIHDPSPNHGLLVGVNFKTGKTAFRFNTSICWSIALHTSDLNSVLCISETKSPPGIWTNHLYQIDTRTGAQTMVGSFSSPNNSFVATYAATYDSKRNIYFAYLARPPPTHAGPQADDCVVGMDASTGKVVSNATKAFELMIKTFSFDEQTGKVFAIVETLNANRYCAFEISCTHPLTYTHHSTAFEEHFGSLDLETMEFKPVGDEVNMYKKSGYSQINTGICVPSKRMYFASMFKRSQTPSGEVAHLYLVGTNLDTGKIEYEYERLGTGYAGNFVDLAYFAA